MSGALAGVAVLAVLIGTGVLAATVLGVGRAAEFALAAYLVVFAEVVALSLLLSAFGALTRTALVAGAVAILVGIVAVWLRAGSPRPPSRPKELARALRAGPLAALAGVAALALAYVSALMVATPPNGWDQLNYHLARAAFWLQSERVAYIDGAYDNRLNFNPPNGEIAMALALAVTRHEVAAGLVQLAAALACAAGVFALARRLGLDRCEALFGALLFLIAPIVLLQSAMTKNDLVVAAFLVAAAVFVLGDSRREIALASLATALAVGAKLTGLYGVVVLLALALAGPSTRDRRALRLAGIAAGSLVGSYWYAINAAETGSVLGDQSHTGGLTAPLHPRENLLTAYGLAVDAVDLSGAEGKDVFLYVVAASLVALVLLLGGRSRRGDRRRAFLGAGVAALLVASPLLFRPLSTELGRPGLYKLHELLGAPEAFLAIDNAQASSPSTASASDSWYGPAGLLLAVAVSVAAVMLVRRRSLPRLALVVAAAPLAWFVLLATTLTYHPFQGRFFVFPVALSASLWGLALRVRPAAWAAVGLAATTALLSLVHFLEKPSGLRLLDRSRVTSVWEMERWEVQSGHAPEMAPIFRFLDEELPREDAVALAFGPDDFGYPVFGPRLERRVELIAPGSQTADVQADWLVASPDRGGDIDRRCWRPVLESDGGTVFTRTRPRGSVRGPLCAPAG